MPSCRAYDPCFGYELTAIVQDGARRMLDAREDVFYYVTVMNESYPQEAMPEGAAEGILRGMYRCRQRPNAQIQLLGAGTILREVIAAADILEQDYGIAADVWSVTSFTELRRDGMDIERWNTLHADEAPRTSYIEQCLAPTHGPVVAASDYVRAVADLVRTWVPRRYVTLGTDGFGRSDTREALRRFFEVDHGSIVVAALKSLADDERVATSVVVDAVRRFGIDRDSRNPWDA